MNIGGDQALARVRAGLGRDPQDPLEAAIALESGGGIIGHRALDLGQQATRVARDQARPPASHRPVREQATWTAPAAVGLVLVSLVWGGMLVSGAHDQDMTGILLGLPVGLGLVGYLDRRFIAGEDGPRRTRANVGEVLLTILAPCVAVSVVQPGGLVGVGVILILACTAFAARFRVAGAVIATVVAGYAASAAGVRPEVAASVSLVVAIAIVVAEIVRLPPLPIPPARLSLAVPRALAGFGLGLLTVPVVELTEALTSTPPMVVILPSTIGGAVGASVLDRMWYVVGDALDGAHTGPQPDRLIGRVYVRLVVTGTIVTLVTTALLSAAVYAAVPVAQEPRVAAVLVAMAAIAVAGFSAAVLQGAVGEMPPMIGLTVAGSVAVAGTMVTDRVALSVVLAVVWVHVVWFPILLHIFRDPERVLATRV